jgi:uroporphyrinogen-III synthase
MSLHGRTIAITAERRSEAQADLFRRRGAEVVHAPTLHTVDLSTDAALRARTDGIVAHPPTWTVATTGFGMRLWFDAADAWELSGELVAALGAGTVVARGPKARSACRKRGLEVGWSAPGETMAEVVAWLAEQPGIGDATVAVQLFDDAVPPEGPDLDSVAGRVDRVPVYRWQPPLDRAPAAALAADVASGAVDAVTFTSQPAVRFLVEIAEEEGLREPMVSAFNDGSVLPVCVGPVCAAAAAEVGITTSIWPDRFRLVPMVELAAERLAG